MDEHTRTKRAKRYRLLQYFHELMMMMTMMKINRNPIRNIIVNIHEYPQICTNIHKYARIRRIEEERQMENYNNAVQY